LKTRDEWTIKHSCLYKSINQFDLTKDLINKVLEFCQVFEAHGFITFSKQWARVDYLQGRQVRYDDNQVEFGIQFF
jgi:biotin-(acetyl-CoA carboxylase) ligase